MQVLHNIRLILILIVEVNWEQKLMFQQEIAFTVINVVRKYYISRVWVTLEGNTGLTDHLQIITTTLNSFTELYTPNITVITAHIESSLHILTFDWLTPRLAAISHQISQPDFQLSSELIAPNCPPS
jgi:hypothetical protein